MNTTKHSFSLPPIKPPVRELDSGFEEAYKYYRYRKLLQRVPVVGSLALAMLSIFVIMDLSYLPKEVYQQTIAVRLGINFPLIVLCIVAALRRWPIKLFESLVTVAYLFAGLAILFVIYAANKHGVYLPYDGILLLFVFGYFILGLGVVKISISSILISVCYVVHELHAQLPQQQLFLNTFFLFTFNCIGIFASYMQNRSQRALFWHESELAERQKKDKREIESKSRLVATASHDLRQPLHAMNLMMDLLVDKLQGRDEYPLTQKIKMSLHQVNKLLDSLMSYSQLEAGVIEVKERSFDLSQLLLELVEEEKARAEAQGVALALNCSSGIEVKTDPVLLRRILRNLLENTLEHAKASTLRFEVTLVEEDVLLSVIDNGVGIPFQLKEQVFEEFSQGDERSQGLGLGLSIIRHLCDLQDIPLTLDTNSFEGCHFSFVLKRAEQSNTQETAGRMNKLDFAELNILVVENDLAILQPMSQLLESWGAKVFAYTSLDQFENASFLDDIDLIVSDFHLKEGETGIDVVHSVRSFRAEKIPALFITADTSIDQDTLKQHGFESEGSYVIHKPIQPAKLRVAVGFLFGS